MVDPEVAKLVARLTAPELVVAALRHADARREGRPHQEVLTELERFDGADQGALQAGEGGLEAVPLRGLGEDHPEAALHLLDLDRERFLGEEGEGRAPGEVGVRDGLQAVGQRLEVDVHVVLGGRDADRDLLLAVAVEEGADVDGVAGAGFDAVGKHHPRGRRGLLVALLEVRAHVEQIEGRAGRRGRDVDVALAVAVHRTEPREEVPPAEAGAIVGDQPYGLGARRRSERKGSQAGPCERTAGGAQLSLFSEAGT